MYKVERRIIFTLHISLNNYKSDTSINLDFRILIKRRMSIASRMQRIKRNVSVASEHVYERKRLDVIIGRNTRVFPAIPARYNDTGNHADFSIKSYVFA